MSLISSRSETIRPLLLRSVWHQWTLIGSTGSSRYQEDAGKQDVAIIDPEALLIASLALLPHERRLVDILDWWAKTGTSLLSVQRTRSLFAQMIPDDSAKEALSAFAATANQAGDRRWKTLAGEFVLEGRPGKGSDQPRLAHPAALLLRLRAAFGVSARIDLLGVLLGLHGREVTVKALAQLAGYSTVAVRTAAEEMALSRFLDTTGEYPAAYQVADFGKWVNLLETSDETDFPVWGHWSVVYGFLLAVTAWADEAVQSDWSPYIAASRARDLIDRFKNGLRLAGYNIPRNEEYQGADYLPAFDQLAQEVVVRMENRV